jgi:hypothetical protein
MTIPSIPEPARIMNPVEGSEPSLPRQIRSGKLISPINRAATNNVLYIFITLLFFGAEAHQKAIAYCRWSEIQNLAAAKEQMEQRLPILANCDASFQSRRLPENSRPLL